MKIPRVYIPPQDWRDSHSSAAKPARAGAQGGPAPYSVVQSPAFSKAAAAWMTEASS